MILLIKKNISILLFCVFFIFYCSNDGSNNVQKGSVIFIHPDGSGASMWCAFRLLEVGPDGMTNWDKMETMGLYRGHLLNSTNSSS